jgi:hypothetical protein
MRQNTPQVEPLPSDHISERPINYDHKKDVENQDRFEINFIKCTLQ